MEGPPELSSRLFSLPKRRPGNHFQPEVTQKTTRAPNYKFPMPKTMPWETFPARDRPEHHQSYQTVNFPRPNDVLEAISSPRSPRRPLDSANNSFSMPKRCPRSYVRPQVTQKPTKASKPYISIPKRWPGSHFHAKVTQKTTRASKLIILNAKNRCGTVNLQSSPRSPKPKSQKTR